MEEIWVKVKGFSNYKISNMGNVVNIKKEKQVTIFFDKQRNNYALVSLFKKGKRHTKPLGRLVVAHFQIKEIDKKFVFHLDLDHKNNKNINLKQASRGDLYRYYYTMKKRQRGVYIWNQTKNKKTITRWRAMLKVNNRLVTVGYTDTKPEAQKLYLKAFKAYYGYIPY